MTALTLRRDPEAQIIPIEDLKDGDVVHTSQIVPTDVINVDTAYELAYAGLSNRGIGGKMGINHITVATHFQKTLDRARADAAIDAIMYIRDVADGVIEKPSKMRYDANVFLLTQRLDPMPKEQPQVTIVQSFNNQSPIFNAKLEDINDAKWD